MSQDHNPQAEQLGDESMARNLAHQSDTQPDVGDLPPPPPDKPLPSDCCGGGCLRCVYDLYDEALQRYELALEEWKRK